MQKHIYANAFICVGRYSAPPKAQINCNRTNLCIKKKGTQWMKDIGRIRGSQASTLFVVLKCYLLNFWHFISHVERVSHRCEKIAITGLRSRASAFTMSSIYAVQRGNESERRDYKHLCSCALLSNAGWCILCATKYRTVWVAVYYRNYSYTRVEGSEVIDDLRQMRFALI